MSSEITSSTARNRYWRSTAPTCQIFPSVACSSVRCMDDGIVHSSTSSMDDFTVVYRQLPRTTLLSSKEDLANDSWHCTLLVMDDPYGQIGDVLIFHYPINGKLIIACAILNACIIIYYYCYYF